MNPYDLNEMSRSPAISAIKAALPHLEPHHRKTLGILVKLIELQNLLESYRHDLSVNTSWSECANQPEQLRNIITAMRPFMQNQNNQMFDTLAGILEMKEALEQNFAWNYAE